MLGLDSGKLLAKSSGWLHESHRAATTLVLEYQTEGRGFIPPATRAPEGVGAGNRGSTLWGAQTYPLLAPLLPFYRWGN